MSYDFKMGIMDFLNKANDFLMDVGDRALANGDIVDYEMFENLIRNFNNWLENANTVAELDYGLSNRKYKFRCDPDGDDEREMRIIKKIRKLQVIEQREKKEAEEQEMRQQEAQQREQLDDVLTDIEKTILTSPKVYRNFLNGLSGYTTNEKNEIKKRYSEVISYVLSPDFLNDDNNDYGVQNLLWLINKKKPSAGHNFLGLLFARNLFFDDIENKIEQENKEMNSLSISNSLNLLEKNVLSSSRILDEFEVEYERMDSDFKAAFDSRYSKLAEQTLSVEFLADNPINDKLFSNGALVLAFLLANKKYSNKINDNIQNASSIKEEEFWTDVSNYHSNFIIEARKRISANSQNDDVGIKSLYPDKSEKDNSWIRLSNKIDDAIKTIKEIIESEGESECECESECESEGESECESECQVEDVIETASVLQKQYRDKITSKAHDISREMMINRICELDDSYTEEDFDDWDIDDIFHSFISEEMYEYRIKDNDEFEKYMWSLSKEKLLKCAESILPWVKEDFERRSDKDLVLYTVSYRNERINYFESMICLKELIENFDWTKENDKDFWESYNIGHSFATSISADELQKNDKKALYNIKAKELVDDFNKLHKVNDRAKLRNLSRIQLKNRLSKHEWVLLSDSDAREMFIEEYVDLIIALDSISKQREEEFYKIDNNLIPTDDDDQIHNFILNHRDEVVHEIESSLNIDLPKMTELKADDVLLTIKNFLKYYICLESDVIIKDLFCSLKDEALEKNEQRKYLTLYNALDSIYEDELHKSVKVGFAINKIGFIYLRTLFK